jgi:hypothetical protein
MLGNCCEKLNEFLGARWGSSGGANLPVDPLASVKSLGRRQLRVVERKCESIDADSTSTAKARSLEKSEQELRLAFD